MNKLESVQLAESNVATAREAYEAAVFALRDAQLLPDDPVKKQWRILVEPNRNAAAVGRPDGDGNPGTVVSLDAGGCLGAALVQGFGSLDLGALEQADILQQPVAGDNNAATAFAFVQPAPLMVIYTAGQNPETGEWSYTAPAPVAWEAV